MKKIFIILFATVTIVSSQTEPLTIEKSLQIGLNSSKEILLANSDTLISDAQVTNAWSSLLPKVTLGFNYNYLSIMPVQLNFPIPTPTSEDALKAIYANATIEQPLFTGFRLLSIKKASEFNKKASLLDFSNTKNTKAFEIHRAFWSYYKTLKLIEVLEENLNLIRLQTKNIQKFVETGLAERNDLLKLNVTEADVKLKLVDAQHHSKIAQANLNRILGLKLNSNTKIITDISDEEIITEKFDVLLNEALKTRLELKANEFRIKAADERITAAKSTWFPQISAFGSYNYLQLDGSTLIDGNANDFWMVGLGMKWNVWDWWKTSSNTTIAEEQHFQIDVTNQMLKERIEIEVYSNFLSLQSEASKIELNKLRVESAQENFRIINDKFNSELATPTELLEASTLLAEAKTMLITSSIDFKLARIKLEKSIGRKIY